ncbi:MAG: 2Fe-2S iron-sulfur cluster binding domain-containing protein [Gammaproteobacteria bacterium]|nr:2Fe-2S iron-sulfur cluster binding domain-containing protein [Gammaproteobacteria bacterium]
MPSITFNSRHYHCRENETLLEVFLRNGVNVPFSCKNGICHACLLRCTNTQPPEAAQKGIKQSLAGKNYLLSCKCKPEQDMEVALPRPSDILTNAILVEKELLNSDIYRLLIDPTAQVYYHAGQIINLHGPEDIVRSYSIASVPAEDLYIELHVKRVIGGHITGWIFDELNVGDQIAFHGPTGACFYQHDHHQQTLLLISTGTGLAPHFGVVRDALHSGHKGDIYLYQFNVDAQDHYLCSELEALAEKHKNFHFSLLTGSSTGCNDSAALGEFVFSQHESIRGCGVYLSGNPAMVTGANEAALRHGVDAQRIFSDPFEDVVAARTNAYRATEGALVQEGIPDPDPDPEMWKALEEGRLLNQILKSFYDRVFEDEMLSPYFHGVTKQRLIEKVYNFLYQIFTGEKVFFGERPRNSHHWMVISGEVFDHRENIMEQCLREHGLAEHLIQRWLKIEYLYKQDIVKQKPINKVMFGVEVPHEGFDTLVMEFSSLCDSCEGEINVGDTVRYHVRMGTTYCSQCASVNSL